MQKIVLPAFTLLITLVFGNVNAAEHPSKTTTLFVQALQNENYELMQTLLAQGADPNCRSCNEAASTPLMFATQMAEMKADHAAKRVVFLIQNGANPNIQDKNGLTALDFALLKVPNPYWSNFQDALYLLDHGANPKLKDKQGNSALHLFAKSAFIPLVGTDEAFRQQELNQLAALTHALLDHGADINQPNNAGDTPLHLAASIFSVYSSKLFLLNGANLQAKNKSGQTPMDIAMEKAAQGSPEGQCMLTLKTLKNGE